MFGKEGSCSRRRGGRLVCGRGNAVWREDVVLYLMSANSFRFRERSRRKGSQIDIVFRSRIRTTYRQDLFGREPGICEELSSQHAMITCSFDDCRLRRIDAHRVAPCHRDVQSLLSTKWRVGDQTRPITRQPQRHIASSFLLTLLRPTMQHYFDTHAATASADAASGYEDEWEIECNDGLDWRLTCSRATPALP